MVSQPHYLIHYIGLIYSHCQLFQIEFVLLDWPLIPFLMYTAGDTFLVCRLSAGNVGDAACIWGILSSLNDK